MTAPKLKFSVVLNGKLLATPSPGAAVSPNALLFVSTFEGSVARIPGTTERIPSVRGDRFSFVEKVRSQVLLYLLVVINDGSSHQTAALMLCDCFYQSPRAFTPIGPNPLN